MGLAGTFTQRVNLRDLARATHRAVSGAVGDTALAGAAEATVRGHQPGAYTQTPLGGSSYGQAASAAQSRNPGAILVPEVPAPTNDTTAAVATATAIGVAEEFGLGAQRKTGPHPWFVPAIEAQGDGFQKRLDTIAQAIDAGRLS